MFKLFTRYSKLYFNNSLLKYLILKNKIIYTTTNKISRINEYRQFNKLNIDQINNYKISKSNINKFTNRTHSCGELTAKHEGERVTLCGWLEYQRMQKFITLRDSYGSTQCYIPNNRTDLINSIKSCSYESVLQITGVVTLRPKKQINLNNLTGEVEVCLSELIILNKAESKLPFNIRNYEKPNESLRMQYRFLDLRFPDMQFNLRYRSNLLMNIREFLINKCGFVDVETPTLFRRTPGGAQEFIVPSQIKGKCYALTQSPQQFKQLLMVGGIDRYFQIAKCYRDERGRSDRQPEFTQLDIEMSFVRREDIMQLIEQLIVYILPKNNIQIPFEQITYETAMNTYGTDKPDTRFEFKIEDCTNELINTKLGKNLGAYAIIISKSEANGISDKFKSTLELLNIRYPQATLFYSVFTTVDDWIELTTEKITDINFNKLSTKFNLKSDDVIFLAYGERQQCLECLGHIRVEYMQHLENTTSRKRLNTLNFLWVTDFPLFETSKTNNILQSVHHPFTMPHLDDIHLLDTAPLSVRSQAYDLVLNGSEIGGGSIRINDSKLQTKILDMLKIDSNELQHLLFALNTGCPPHGGIALGIDRLLATILNTLSIRDVIAFPKGIDGKDLMSGAPTNISSHDINIYGLDQLKTR